MAEFIVDGVITKRDWRPNQVTFFLNKLFYVRVGVICFRFKFTAKVGFCIRLENREIPSTVITDHQRFVIGYQLSKQTEYKERGEKPHRPISAFIGFKSLETGLN